MGPFCIGRFKEGGIKGATEMGKNDEKGCDTAEALRVAELVQSCMRGFKYAKKVYLRSSGKITRRRTWTYIYPFHVLLSTRSHFAFTNRKVTSLYAPYIHGYGGAFNPGGNPIRRLRNERGRGRRTSVMVCRRWGGGDKLLRIYECTGACLAGLKIPRPRHDLVSARDRGCGG